MAENVQIGVTETINVVDVTPTIVSQVVDISVTDNTDEVTLVIEPNLVQINITKGLNADDLVTSINGSVGDVTITKSTLGLGNVDNTSDANKPISNATQTALNAKADTSYVNTQLSGKQNTLGYTPYNATNPSGYISAVTQAMINEALGYTPYSASNPSNYISGITSLNVTNALGYTPYNASNPSGFISGITSLMVTNALGFTPYSSSNPSNFISLASLSAGTGISYNNTTGQIASTITQYTNSDARGAISLTTVGTSGVATYNSTTGVLNIPSYTGGGGGGSGTVTSVALSAPIGFSVSGSPITTTGTLALSFAVGYSLPSDATQATWSAKQNALNGTGFVKISGTTISYDNSTYLTGITSGQVTTALGFTPYNSTNPNGYISSITSLNVTTALGFTPYNATNPSNYIALGALSSTATGLTYTNTTGVFSLTAGYAIPTTSSQTNWDTAYTNRITSLTTTGSSGSATLTTNTLNIPTYTLAGLGGQASSTNLTSLSGLSYVSASFVKMTASGTFTLDTNTYYLNSNPSGFTSNAGTVTSVSALTLGTTGTDVSSTVATGTTTPVITLNLPSASATNRGLLTSADWSTFNGKQSALSGTGFVKSTAGTISYDTNTYLTANQSITLSGAITGSGSTAITTSLASSVVGVSNLSATGTPSATTYLRGDNTWATIAGGSGSPGGTSGQVQYNNAGAFGGASYVNINSNGLLQLNNYPSTPTTPSASTMLLYAEDHAGKTIPSVMSPTGADYNLQAALYGTSTYMWLASTGTTVSIAWGTTFTALNAGTSAAQSTPTKASTNAMTSMNRANFGTGTTATGSSGIVSANTVAWLGNAVGLGGFLFFARFGVETLSGTHRVLVGLSANTAALAAEPSTLANTIALGYDSTDTTWQIITRSATTLTKTNTAITITAGQILDLYIHSAPNSGSVQFHIKNGSTGADLYVGTSISTNLPATTQFLSMQAQISSLTGTTAKVLALNRMYLETDI